MAAARAADTLITVGGIHTHCMGDTKRGRERKGTKKREQRRYRDIERAVESRDEELDFDDLYDEDEFKI